MMNRFFFMAVVSIMLAGPALSFERSAQSASDKPVPTEIAPLDLSEGKAHKEKTESGGLVLPGLGALGVLPKLDFGLELLYGENQPQRIEPEQEDLESDGLRIKGTLKHRF